MQHHHYVHIGPWSSHIFGLGSEDAHGRPWSLMYQLMYVGSSGHGALTGWLPATKHLILGQVLLDRQGYGLQILHVGFAWRPVGLTQSDHAVVQEQPSTERVCAPCSSAPGLPLPVDGQATARASTLRVGDLGGWGVARAGKCDT
jgi:hypothetical protein